MKYHFLLLLLLSNILKASIPGAFSITRIQYDGGGDWYSDPSSIPNLLQYVKDNTNIKVNTQEKRGKIGDDIFNNSNYFYLTGHGNIKFNHNEAQMLRDQLLNGAFLHADDNYGMDKYFKREMKNVFPEKEWVELPLEHPIFNIYYKFPNGLPKIHEHDNKRPQALGLFNEGKLMVLYTYESDLGDGWENPNIHGAPQELHEKALEIGTNIILYALNK
ncbi:MAG: DUF4159 domain-containing protein [Candidatus Neomarinimicrobiota bacterium]|nr:DUF4159 domain-containing protein [Candidatus Neomarinimicrobiota bacterium]